MTLIGAWQPPRRSAPAFRLLGGAAALLTVLCTALVGCGAGDQDLAAARAVDASCDDDHPATVDAVAVASSDPSTPVGTTRRAVWTVSCFDDDDPTLEGAWPPGLEQVRTALTRAAWTISCPAGSRRSLFEAESSDPAKRVFGAGGRSVGWFVTDVRSDGCDPGDGVRWEFEATVSRRPGRDGSPGYLAAGRIEARSAARDGESDLAVELRWDACTDFCFGSLRVERTRPAGGFPELLTASTPLYGSFDPRESAADFVLYIDCDDGEPRSGETLVESQARRRVTVRAADLSTLQDAGQLVVEAPRGSLEQVAIDGRCSEDERAIDARLGVGIRVASVTSRSGSAVAATTSTAPPAPDVEVDIPLTGSEDRSLGADLGIGAAERARLLDRDEFAAQYALAEWGPFVLHGVLWLIVGSVLWRRRGSYPAPAAAGDRVDLVRESCQLAAQRSRERRRSLTLGPRLVGVVAGGVALVVVPMAVLGRTSRWSDIAVPRLIAANLVSTLVVVGVLVGRPPLRGRRMARRMDACDRQVRWTATDPVDAGHLMAVVVATIDALPHDDVEVSETVGGHTRDTAVGDDFDAATTTAIELTRRLIRDARPTRPDGLDPRTLAARRYLDEVAPEQVPAGASAAAHVATGSPASSRRRPTTGPRRGGRPRGDLTIGAIATSPEIRATFLSAAALGTLGAAAFLLSFVGDVTTGTRIRGVVVGGLVVVSFVSVLWSLRTTATSSPIDAELQLTASTPNRRWYRVEIGGDAERYLGISTREELPEELTCQLHTGPGPRHDTIRVGDHVIVAPRRTRPPANATPLER